MKYWKIKEVIKSDDGNMVLSVKLRDVVNNSYSAFFKWDGCMEITKYDNGYTPDDPYSEEVEENSDSIHICHIDEMIERLQEIKEIMLQYNIK